jgi:polyribonucleotide nucleotidyltransferase
VAVVEKIFKLGDRQISLQTGLMARQATSSVVVRMNNAMVLVTLVAEPSKEQRDFFPLSVHYQSKAYAYGRIPSGFKRREGPPIESEILISRLIDRPIRPLFPQWYTDEVQIVATLLSTDITVEPDILAMIGAAAALRLAGLPVTNTIGAVRVGYEDNKFVINPVVTPKAALDLVMAGTKDSLLMVESSAAELSEETMIAALDFGHQHIREIVSAIDEFANQVGAQSLGLQAPAEVFLPGFTEFVASYADSYWTGLLNCADKTARGLFMKEELKKLKQTYHDQHTDLTAEQLAVVDAKLVEWEKKTIRQGMIQHKKRVDGRTFEQVRSIECIAGLLPASHGSALFTRGETQSLTSLVLGTARDAQLIEAYEAKEQRDWLMLHYNFPPFSVGEVGQVGSPKRREIGHGRLARRALEAVLPSTENFRYVLRLVSEILESNGSSSMATVCASSLALMDAGVPITAPVAGIAMGLIQEGSQHVVLTDILGDEDFLGDMDFKVAGTERGITALQMDIKIEGISAEVMKQALAQAQTGRLHILGIMNATLATPRSEIAANAPRIDVVKIRPEQVREVIGKGGSTVKMITELSGATLELTDDGSVSIVSSMKEQSNKAKELLKQIVEPLALGNVYTVQVTKMLEYGFVVATLGGKEGLVHISECLFSEAELPNKVTIGQRLDVKLSAIDKVNNRFKFSMLV